MVRAGMVMAGWVFSSLSFWAETCIAGITYWPGRKGASVQVRLCLMAAPLNSFGPLSVAVRVSSRVSATEICGAERVHCTARAPLRISVVTVAGPSASPPGSCVWQPHSNRKQKNQVRYKGRVGVFRDISCYRRRSRIRKKRTRSRT
jgi:hypothetical protein